MAVIDLSKLPTDPREDAERNRQMFQAWLNGASLYELSLEYKRSVGVIQRIVYRWDRKLKEHQLQQQ